MEIETVCGYIGLKRVSLWGAEPQKGPDAVAELVSGSPFSCVSWAEVLACRWASAELECLHLGEPH